MELLGAAAEFVIGIEEFKIAQHAIVADSAKLVETAAKTRIGDYQGETGPTEAWSALADSTKETRVKLGFSEDDPLLRTGELRDSIESEAEGFEAVVGSNEDKALFAEVGTATQPPRSFLEGGFYDVEDQIEEAIGAAIDKIWMNW